MKPSSFQIESSLSPAELRASLSKRCREWRWPPSISSREVGFQWPRITGGPERFRVWIWPHVRETTPVLDCRTTAKSGGGCTVQVRMRRSRQDQLSGITLAACFAGVAWLAGWGSPGAFFVLGLVPGAGLILYNLYEPFQKRTEQRMLRLVEALNAAAKPEETSSVRRAT